MAPNQAAFHAMEDVLRWCELNSAELEAAKDGRWHIKAWTNAIESEDDMEAFGQGLMGAFEALMLKHADLGVTDSFVSIGGGG